MQHNRRELKTGFKVYTHQELSRATEEEVRSDSSRIFADADQGIQTAITSDDGKAIRSVIGLNGTRYLPDPDPDPLDEVLRAALTRAAKESK